MSSRVKSVIKYVCALALLALILHRAGPAAILGYLRQIPPGYLALAFVTATLAQLASCIRMRFFFTRAGYGINLKFAMVLYYVGAFYNFVLPGGIGGDAYKVILVRKRMEMPARHGIYIMLADRGSGLCVLLLTLYATLWAIPFSAFDPHLAHGVLVLAAIVTLAGYLIFAHYILKTPPGAMLASLPYSMIVQVFWIATLLVLWLPLGKGMHGLEYVCLYCAASVMAMLPLSVGGLGIKEVTYFYGAALLQRYAGDAVDGDIGVALSLCIFVLMLVTSLPGLFWLNKVGGMHPHPAETQ